MSAVDEIDKAILRLQAQIAFLEAGQKLWDPQPCPDCFHAECLAAADALMLAHSVNARIARWTP